MPAQNHIDAKKQLNIRVNHDVYKRIEDTGRSKQAVVADALKLYFDGCPEQDDSTDAAMMMEQIVAKDRQIAELHVMLQTSINSQQKLLASPSREHWWQFWRDSP